MRSLWQLTPLMFAMAQISMNCQPQNNGSAAVPADFRFEALSGGLHPWEENRYVHIDAKGEGTFERSIPQDLGAPPLEESKFTLQPAELAKLWQAIQQNSFFSLAREHKDESVSGGWFASLTITAAGNTHQVTVQNFHLPAFANVLRTLNNFMPAGKELIFDGGEP